MRAVDLFAGAGGFSTGATLAGVDVVWAANHWPEAVAAHKQNHPTTEHVCQDLHQADWTKVPAHDILLASPACTGHTHARGKDRPHHDAARSTAWAVVSALECHRTQVAVVENVPQFLDWVLYPSWLDALKRVGYTVAPHTVDSADFGVAQHRERVFLVLTRSKKPLHLEFEKRQHVPVDSILQWNKFKWSPLYTETRSPATVRQAETCLARGDRGIFAYYKADRLRGAVRSLSKPMGTVTTHSRFGLVRRGVAGPEVRMVQVPEYVTAMGFPRDYKLPSNQALATQMLGNAVVPAVASEFISKIKRAA